MSDDGSPAVEEKKKRGRPGKANDTAKVMRNTIKLLIIFIFSIFLIQKKQ